MSRYEFIAHDRRYLVIVGWDSPLATFFWQAFDTTLGTTLDENEETTACVLWEGLEPREIVSIEALQERLSRWATIPEEIAQHLRQDQAQATAPSPALASFQRYVALTAPHQRVMPA